MNPSRHRRLAEVDALRLKGYEPIPLRVGTKKPLHCGWQTADYDWPAIVRSPVNLGIRTGNSLVVVDCDNEDIVAKVVAECGSTPMQCRTPRGRHLYFRAVTGRRYGGHVKLHGLPVDLRSEGHFVVCPWSVSADGVAYRWLGVVVAAGELPVLESSWVLPPNAPTGLVTASEFLPTNRQIRRARSYLAQVPGAVSGKNGHGATMRVAGILIQKFGLTIADAWPLMIEFNQRCEPPWSEKELLHKLQDAHRNLERSLKGGD